ncbi:MAG: SPFH domain-containing protein [Thermodesulfobacteriota bacterium]
MATTNPIHLEHLEWFDDQGQHLVHRLPEHGSAEIKYGAQLTVRDSQAAILFYKGRACDSFGPGRHTLKTGNIPIITKILSIPWGMTSPLRAEVYFANLKEFTNLKWGTKNPVAFKDQELGLIRLRAHGVFNLQVSQPALFINAMVGTMAKYSTEEIGDYLKQVIVSRFNDHLGQQLDSLFNLPGRYDELSQGLQERLAADFAHFGLGLTKLYITSITPPPEVQRSIDDQSRLEVIKDMDRLIQLKAAAAMEKAADNQGGSGEGMGLGLGMMIPSIFARQEDDRGEKGATITCPDCRGVVPDNSRFCPLCGHQIVVLRQCGNCGKNLAAGAKFCSRCGHPADEKPQPVTCPGCGQENMPGAQFCNNCGEKV